MHVCMIADTYKPYVSGVTVAIDLCKRELARRGHEVTVLAYGPGAPAEPGVIHSPGVRHPTGYHLGYPLSRPARRAAAAADIIHLHHPFLSGRAALAIACDRGIPTVFTNHTRYDIYTGVYVPLLVRPIARVLLGPYMRRFCRKVSLVIAPSEGIRSWMLASGVDSPVDVVPNPVDIGPFLRERDPSSRTTHGIDQDTVLFCYTGRLSPEKRLDLLLDAFSLARARDGRLALMLVGDGPSRAELEARALQAGLGGAVRFAGMVEHGSMPQVLAACDAFVSTSMSEAHPLTFLEAMAVGLPTVGVESPGVSDIIRHESTGLLAPPEPEAVASALTRLAADGSLRDAMGSRAREASRGYDISHIVDALLARYERLAAQR